MFFKTISYKHFYLSKMDYLEYAIIFLVKFAVRLQYSSTKYFNILLCPSVVSSARKNETYFI